PDPPYLRALQAEGLAHERAVYRSLYPRALRIPEQAPRAERVRLTLDAVRQGAPTILQGYLACADGVGVVDVLELVGDDSAGSSGHRYRVGEIKRSAVLHTAHVFQATWYTDLLGQGAHRTQSAFFILGDRSRQEVNLSASRPDYSAVRERLLRLRRQADPEPGPHLQPACASCHWRGLCMPRLVSQEHLSLVPGLGRPGVRELQGAGVDSWRGLPGASPDALAAAGLKDVESQRALRAVRLLQEGLPPLVHPLQPDRLGDLIPVSLEFPYLAEERRAGDELTPRALHFDAGWGLQSVRLENRPPEIVRSELTSLVRDHRLALYGATDVLGLLDVMGGRSAVPRSSLVDLLWVVEQFVHSPLMGLDLASVASGAGSGTEPLQPLNAPQRVEAIKSVSRWVWQASCRT
ncbi:MAG: Dna2/Cas4 domain-containing protein, partial [Chloroflexi bacterium]|nr:Dna2/Cas4 domain-containing protein [Chloroflexota bacterium]